MREPSWIDRLPQLDPNMSKRSIMMHITAIPPEISREAAVAFLHNHKEMIEMNPLVIHHGRSSAPPNASRDEAENMTWYELTDEIQYIPGTGVKGEVTYRAGFYDLPRGLQTHVFAPGGVDIHGKWMIGGNMPGEEREPVELGVNKPADGLYIREDVDLKCNVFLANFVKKNLKKSHGTVVERLIKKAREMGLADPSLRRSTSNISSKSDNVVMRRNSLITSPVPYNQLYVPSSGRLHRTTPAPLSNSSQLSQRVCSCLGTRHHPACRFFIDMYQQPDNPSPVSRDVSPLPRSAQPTRSTTWEQTPTSAYSVDNRRNTTCFCSGGVHLEGCPSYPGLRFSPPRRSVSPLEQPGLRDSQQLPYQLQFTYNPSSPSPSESEQQPRPSVGDANSMRSATSHRSQNSVNWAESPYNPNSGSSPLRQNLLNPPQQVMKRTSTGHIVLMELEGDAAQRYYEYQAQRAAELE